MCHCTECDNHNHFIVCLAFKLIFHLLHIVLEVFIPHLPLEKLINGDICVDDDKCFTIVWILALTTEYYWDCRRTHTTPLQESLYGMICANLQILSHISAVEFAIPALKYVIYQAYSNTS